MTDPETILTLCRMLFAASGMILWGGAAYLSALVAPDLAARLWLRLARSRHIALAAILFSTLASLPTHAAMLGNGWQDAVNPAILSPMLTGTTIGTAWCLQALATLALLAAHLTGGRKGMIATALAAMLALTSLPVTGHATINPLGAGIWHQAIDLIHLLAAGSWLGALPPVYLLLARKAGSGTPDGDMQAQTRALMRFSTAGHVAVTLTVATGIANSLFILGIPHDLGNLYVRLLLAKALLVGMMIGLAVVNRYAFVPRLRVGRWAGKALRIGTLAELAIAMVVIFLVAWFGTLDPG